MTVLVACAFCKQNIDADRAYRKVTGWERRRNQGGTNALRLREPRDEFACESCINHEARGVSYAQGGLFA